MSEVTHPRGGEPAKEKPFPSGKIPEADGNRPEGDDAPKGAPNPRDAIVARMAEHADEDRIAKLEADRLQTEGLESREEMFPDRDQPRKQEPRPRRESVDDPLADHVVVRDGKAFMKLKVDGKETLVAMDSARATLQKHEAAEVRLQKANDWQKTLASREAQIAEKERQLAQRTQQQILPPAPRVADADDPNFLSEVQSVVSDLFDGKEKEAASKLAKVLSRGRTPVVVQTPMQIDKQALVREVVTEVKKVDAQEDYRKNLTEGYESFKKDFPEIVADELLFAAVDKVTERIEAENPDWTPAKIMKEAGTEVREWAKGKGLARTPTENPAQDRLEAKRGLVPMPTAREGSPPRQEEEREQTPSEAFAEIRRQRGQPV